MKTINKRKHGVTKTVPTTPIFFAKSLGMQLDNDGDMNPKSDDCSPKLSQMSISASIKMKLSEWVERLTSEMREIADIDAPAALFAITKMQ